MYWTLDGHKPVPCTLRQWGELYGRDQEDKRRLASTYIDDVWISTVFLGIDHGWASNVPILFETMAFGGPIDQYQDRYATWDEAIAGHERMCEAVREAMQTSFARKLFTVLGGKNLHRKRVNRLLAEIMQKGKESDGE